jgi:hypothetical protein
MDVVKAAQLSGRTLERVVVHPLVLLSIVDHYNRVARDTRKRVVGVLLGTSSRGSVDVTNSYAGIPPTPAASSFFFVLCPPPLGFAPLRLPSTVGGCRASTVPLRVSFRGIGCGCRCS